jgi:cell division topological specificity factor
MLEFLRKLFGVRSNTLAQKAKGRLISVLIHDRTDISPQLLENLRMEMIALLKKYMDIDESNIEINLDRGGREVALVANVPVLRVKRGTADLSETDSTEESETTRTDSPRNHNKNRRHR